MMIWVEVSMADPIGLVSSYQVEYFNEMVTNER